MVDVIVRPPSRSINALLRGSYPKRQKMVVLGSGPFAGQEVPVTDCKYSVDLYGDVRLSGSMDVAATDEWLPVSPSHPLDMRSATEFQIWEGAIDDDGAEHWWSRGVIRISSHSVGRGPRKLSVNFADRAEAVKRAGIRRRWVGDAQDYIIASVSSVLAEVTPWIEMNLDTSNDQIFGQSVIIAEYGDDVWSKCRKLLQTISLDLHFDRNGIVVATPITDPFTAEPVEIYGLTSESVSADLQDVLNVCGVEWQEAKPEDAPTDWTPTVFGRVEAIDETTSTGINSPLGPIARAYSGDASVIHTEYHARLATESELFIKSGFTRAATGSKVPDPRDDVGIPVEIDGVTHVVSKLDIDFHGVDDTGIDFGAASPDLAAMIAAQMRPPKEYQTTEIVVSVNPLLVVLASEQGGSEISVQWTDALRGVEVGDPITVLHKGAGLRVGVALLVKKPLVKAYAGEKVVTVNPPVGANYDLEVGDTLDIPEQPPPDYPSNSLPYPSVDGGTARGNAGSVTLQAINDNRTDINYLRAKVNQLQANCVDLNNYINNNLS